MIIQYYKALITRFRKARLRSQLLLAINLSFAVIMAGFLYIDYQQGVQTRLQDKEIALSEEARTIEAAVQNLKNLGPDAVQKHIDTVCSMMKTGESPGHTIEVALGHTILRAKPESHGHDHDSPWSELVSGSSSSQDIRVRVGERRDPVFKEARHAALTRIGAVTFAAIIGAVILNILLVHLVTRPLEQTVHAVRDVGSGKLGTTINITSNHELRQLAQEVSAMSQELERRGADRNAQLNRARRLQLHLIPQQTKQDNYGVAIEYHPAEEIAGDFVDVLPCPNGDTLVCVADVVGHGIHAAMGSAVLKALLLSLDLSDRSPASMLATINQRYSHTSLPEDFATMAMLRISADSSSARYASAGHEHSYLRHADGSCDELASTGLVLGVDNTALYFDREITLTHKDLLVLLSDGVTEAQNTDGNLLGRHAVAAIIKNTMHSHATDMANELISEAIKHRGDAPILDDMTVLVLNII